MMKADRNSNCVLHCDNPSMESTLHALVRAEVNFTRKGVRICRDESFSHTGKRKLSSAPSASRTIPLKTGEWA